MNELLVSRFRIKPPLVKPSKLTSRDVGGVGKDLSDGWAVNFVINFIESFPASSASVIRRVVIF
ncbi:MAG: hypothetical protein LM601_08720 [Candidatus Verstraetearchaeota archaeon]|nr:hypothetical protein [Candidatus Verstraetearchaeota archaeon]